MKLKVRVINAKYFVNMPHNEEIRSVLRLYRNIT